MKKFRLLTLIAAMFAFVLVGCSSGNGNANGANDANDGAKNNATEQNAAEETTADQKEIDAAVQDIKKKGKLVLATSADYPPYEWHLLKDGKDEIVGFDIEIAKELADSLDVELEIKDLDFEGIIPSLASGQADIAIAGLSTTPERLNAVNMSIPYFENKQVALVPKDKADQYKSMDDFAGKVVAAQTGSLQENTVRENFPKDVELKSLPRINNLALEVKNGTADALVISISAGEQYAKQFPELVAIKVGIPDEPGVCIATQKDNDGLTAYVNQELKKMIDEGKIDEWFNEYEKISSESVGAEDAESADAGNNSSNNDNAANQNDANNAKN
ncbi:MAG: transporter substrate-binding domain-containing protein [Peptoniphilus sp.]|nr:transporter substrate-binding domain-containing protein [Peptoniphilus sp.]MDD7362547.1 transporter substrate-binding domain-containing protein [Bacillota bacterium]MDY6045054.1 transporter substrate-binding domain-containing protein [Peptoniphilus sp.]